MPEADTYSAHLGSTSCSQPCAAPLEVHTTVPFHGAGIANGSFAISTGGVCVHFVAATVVKAQLRLFNGGSDRAIARQGFVEACRFSQSLSSLLNMSSSVSVR